MKDFRDVLARWPSLVVLAKELRMPYNRVRKWQTTNSVPGRHLLPLIRAAKKRGIKLRADKLIRLYNAGNQR